MTQTLAQFIGLDARSNAYKAFLSLIDVATEENDARNAAIAEADANALLPRSVVLPTYKVGYKLNGLARCAAKGIKPTKAALRSNGDWIANILEDRVLKTVVVVAEDGTKATKQVLNVELFDAILDANGITKHHQYNRETPGWQGRLRMSGSKMLRSVVAKADRLVLPGEGEKTPPTSFVDAHI